MKPKQVMCGLLAMFMMCMLPGCQRNNLTGPAVSGISDERREYLEKLAGGKKHTDGLVDITAAIDFVDTLNQTLPENQKIRDYTTSYDPEDSTVYVEAGNGTLAIKLSEDGTVEFASASGADKMALNQAILKGSVGAGISESVAALFKKAEQIKWLNNINFKHLETNLSSIDMTTIDMGQLTIQQVHTPGMSDFELEVNGGLEPVLTEHLELAGLQDLSDYFEAPELDKFWADADLDTVLQDQDYILSNGSSLRDYYHSISISSRDPITLEAVWEEKNIDLNLQMPTISGAINDSVAPGDGAYTELLKKFLDQTSQFTNNNDSKIDKWWNEQTSK